MKRISIYFGLLILLLPTLLSAQINWTQYANYNDVTAISREGDNLWLGASGAIIKYNILTEEKTIYNNANSPVPWCIVKDIVINNDGVKWFATTRGLISYDDTEWTIYDTIPVGTVSGFTCMAADSLGVLWLGSYSQGVFTFDGTVWTNLNTGNSMLPGNQISAIGIDDNQVIWVGSYNDSGPGSCLSRISGNTWQNLYHSETTFNLSHITSIALTSTGTLWLGQSWGGITSFNGTIWTTYTAENSPPPSLYISDVTVSPTDVVWVAGYNYDLGSYDGQDWVVYNQDNYNSARTVYVDSTGIVWGGFATALVQKQDEEWVPIHFSTCDDVPFYNVIDMVFPTPDNLWAMTEEGLIHFDQETWSLVSFPDLGFPHTYTNVTGQLTVDNANNFWFGTRYNGSDEQLVKYDGTTVTTYNVDNSPLPTGSIPGLSGAPNGDIWLLKGTGIYRFDGETWYSYGSADIPNFNGFMLYDIICDGTGRVYAHSYGYLHIFNGVSWSTLSLPYNHINDMYVDSQNRLWMVGERILLKYADNVLTYWTHTNTPAIPDYECTAVAVDADGYIWIGANGLVKTDLTTWQQFNCYDSGLASGVIADLQFDDEGNLWISTADKITKMETLPVGTTDNEETASPAVKLTNYPNPFSKQTTISYILTKDSPASVNIYNLKGQLTRRLYSGVKSVGNYTVEWDGLSDKGVSCPAGIYLVKANLDGRSFTRKILRQ